MFQRVCVASQQLFPALAMLGQRKRITGLWAGMGQARYGRPLLVPRGHRWVSLGFENESKNLKVKVTQLCLTLCDPGRNTGVVAVPFSRGSSQPRDPTQVSCTAGRFFTNRATREAQA